jgi:hypothetical protein
VAVREKVYQLPTAMPCADEIVKPLARIRTRLNPFDGVEQEQLINWGYRCAMPPCVRTRRRSSTSRRRHGGRVPDIPWDSPMHGHRAISVTIALTLAILPGSHLRHKLD